MSHDDPPPSRSRPSARTPVASSGPSASPAPDAPPASSRASTVPGSSRASSLPPSRPSAVPGSSGRAPSDRPPGSRRAPLVEVISPLPGGQPGEGEGPETRPSHVPPSNGPRPGAGGDEAARQRGLLVGVGAMLLVPAALLGVVLAYVPRLRPWAAEPAAAAATVADAEQAVPEGKALVAGRVVDDEGEPVEGARVTAVARGAKLAEQTTGRGGVYALVLDPGAQTLVAEHDERMVASAELTLRAGEARRDLVLPLGLTRTVRGRVTGADGAAVAGAQLRVEGLPWLQRSATSEADGVYRLARVPSAEATLRVTAPGYAVASVRLRPPSAPGDEVIDLRLSPEDDIEGQVTDPSGQPVAAEVQACDGRETGQRLATDPDGKFKLTRVFARCPLVAYHDSYSPSEPALAEGGRATLRLRAGGSIEGVVVDETGRPVRPFTLGVESFVPSFGDRTAVGGEARAFDDPGGAFRLDRLAPGSYVLTVAVAGRTPARSAPIEVRPEQPTRGVRVALARPGSVEGLVFDDDRRSPLAGARVLFDVTSSLRLTEPPPAASSDRAGRFRLEGAPAGPFTLRVEHEGYRTRLVTGLKVASGETLRQEIALHPAADGGSGFEFSGIGASLASSPEGLAFTAVFEGSPAAAAGLHDGDRLRRIDGQSTEGLSLADAIQRLRGDRGSIVRVTVERPPAGDIIDLPITRGDIIR